MTNLEKKVDALIRVILADNQMDFKRAKADLMVLSVNEKEDPLDLEREIRKILLELGIPDKRNGHRYAVEAILLTVESEDYLHMLHRKLYPAIAEKFDTTPRMVESGIRRAVEAAWDRGDLKVLEKYFGNTISRYASRPTTGEFLARMTNEVRYRMKEAKDRA